MLYQQAEDKGHLKAEERKLWAQVRLIPKAEYANDCFVTTSLLKDLIKQDEYPEIKAYAITMKGDRYQNGSCARKDLDKALDSYGESCDLGETYGCEVYNLLKKMRKETKEYRKKCEQGDSYACISYK